MRSKKGSHRIVVDDVEYRWRANGNDGYILLVIWPSNGVGSCITGTFRYHETWIRKNGCRILIASDQIVITNRIVIRVIRYAIEEHAYDPMAKGPQVDMKCLDDKISWSDAIRGLRY